jgi:hypothetical protein
MIRLQEMFSSHQFCWKPMDFNPLLDKFQWFHLAVYFLLVQMLLQFHARMPNGLWKKVWAL